jgi:hypothetical protein
MTTMRFFIRILFGLMTVCVASGAAFADATDCLHEANLKSPPGVRASKVSFRNSSKDQRRVYWINGNGTRQFFSDVSPGQTYDVSTFAAHIWVVTDSAEKCVSVVVASSAPIMVDIGAVMAAPIAAQPAKPVPPPVASQVRHTPADACSRNEVYSSSLGRCVDKAVTCSRHEVYSSSLGRCISKAATCSKNQVYSSSMGQCVSKAVTCSPNQVYSSSLGQCVSKAVNGSGQKVTIIGGCPYKLEKVCTKTSSGKLTNCHCAS